MTRYAILAVLILAILSAGYIQHLRTKLHNTEQGRDAAISDYRNVTTKYVNSQGDIVSQSKSFELSRNEFKKALKSNDLKWIKKFNDYKRTQSASSFTTLFAPDKVIRDTVYIPCQDSIKAFKYHYKDVYNDIEATVIDTPKISILDKYYVIVTRNRPKNWFIKLQWSRFEFHGQVTNLNRLIKTDSVTTILVR